MAGMLSGGCPSGQAEASKEEAGAGGCAESGPGAADKAPEAEGGVREDSETVVLPAQEQKPTAEGGGLAQRSDSKAAPSAEADGEVRGAGEAEGEPVLVLALAAVPWESQPKAQGGRREPAKKGVKKEAEEGAEEGSSAAAGKVEGSDVPGASHLETENFEG